MSDEKMVPIGSLKIDDLETAQQVLTVLNETIKQKEDLIAELVEALEPFANEGMLDHFRKINDDAIVDRVRGRGWVLLIRDFRRARTAINKAKGT